MPNVCRTGDIGVGICPNHITPQPYTTVFISGSEDVSANGISICAIGTVGISTCGHPTVAVTGSENNFINGLGIHRVGDTGVNFGPYVAVSGSDTIFSDLG